MFQGQLIIHKSSVIFYPYSKHILFFYMVGIRWFAFLLIIVKRIMSSRVIFDGGVWSVLIINLIISIWRFIKSWFVEWLRIKCFQFIIQISIRWWLLVVVPVIRLLLVVVIRWWNDINSINIQWRGWWLVAGKSPAQPLSRDRSKIWILVLTTSLPRISSRGNIYVDVRKRVLERSQNRCCIVSIAYNFPCMASIKSPTVWPGMGIILNNSTCAFALPTSNWDPLDKCDQDVDVTIFLAIGWTFLGVLHVTNVSYPANMVPISSGRDDMERVIIAYTIEVA